MALKDAIETDGKYCCRDSPCPFLKLKKEMHATYCTCRLFGELTVKGKFRAINVCRHEACFKVCEQC